LGFAAAVFPFGAGGGFVSLALVLAVGFAAADSLAAFLVEAARFGGMVSTGSEAGFLDLMYLICATGEDKVNGEGRLGVMR
jgi:hypothetical protein